ncbi:MAG: cytochrome b, partial [Arenibacterium sp.]
MPVSNSTQSYGSVTKTFHWLTALLVLTLIPLGIIANRLPYDTSEQLAQKAYLFSLHKTLGVTMFAVAVLRILWALAQPKPGALNAKRRVEHLLAETVHWLLYGSLVLVPLT